MHPADEDAVSVTANDLLKQRSEAWLPRSITIAVLLHVAVFTLSPDMTTAADTVATTETRVIIPAKLDLPDPPPPIEKPATPIAGSLEIDPDVTISSTNPDTYRMDPFPPPARLDSGERQQFERFVHSMVAPRLLNPDEVERELRRTYPAILRDAGIGGDVEVNLWLDENGRVVKSEIGRGSGYEQLDDAALKVVDAMRLTPALNRDTPVRVIVTVPVRFRVQ